MNPRDLQQIGPYPVVEFVAEGGMAWVFKVEDPRFKVHRALKMLKPQAALGEEFQRFESEAKLLARIEHPNLITIYDFGKDEATGCHYYTMTFVDGAPLSETEPVAPETACPIFIDVLSALSRLHDQGIIHRDIKPGNILVMSDGRVLLGDLGIARQQDQMLSLTRTGMAIGSVQYMSPEQARGEVVDPSSDVFSMGLTLYQVLTGHTIYDSVDEVDATSGEQVLMYLGALLHSGAELQFRFPAHVPRPLRRVIETACRFEPSQRYPHAAAMRTALLEALHAPPREPAGRARALGIAGGGLAALALAAAVGWWALSGGGGAVGPEPALRPFYQAAVERLQDPDASVAAKRQVVAEIGSHGDADATTVLMAAASDSSARVAVDAVKQLNERVDERVGAHLMSLLESDEYTVRAWAARGLGEAGWSAALPALEARLEREDHDAARRWIVRAIEDIAASEGAPD